MKVFIIAGKSGSGKTSVAKIISDYYNNKNKKVLITGYAKYLKLYAHEMLDWDFNEEDKPRTFLQEMGSFIRTDMKLPNMLNDRLLMDLDIYKHFFDVVVISDARYASEINYIKNHTDNVRIFKVEGSVNPKLNLKQIEHESEVSVDKINDYDYLIENDGSYASLRALVYQILEGEER